MPGPWSVRGVRIGARVCLFSYYYQMQLFYPGGLLYKIWPACMAYRLYNLGAVSMQLFTLGIIKSSSAWTLAIHADCKTALVEDLGGHDIIDLLFALDLFLFVGLKWTENSEWTGLWSENLDSPLPYHICLRPSPFHNIRSHLSLDPQ